MQSVRQAPATLFELLGAVVAELVADDDAVAAVRLAKAARREEAGEREPEVRVGGVTLGVEQHDFVDVALGEAEAAVVVSLCSPAVKAQAAGSPVVTQAAGLKFPLGLLFV